MIEQHVSTETLAKLLVLSERRVRQLTEAGVLERARDPESGEELKGRYVLRAAINAYVVFLRDHRYIDPGEADYQRSRARRMSALAAVEELKLKRIHGELHHARDVEFVMTQMLTAFKQRMLALPSRLCHSLQAQTDPAQIAETLRVEIYAALSELSECDPAKFEAANEEYLASIGAAKPPGPTAGS